MFTICTQRSTKRYKSRSSHVFGLVKTGRLKKDVKIDPKVKDISGFRKQNQMQIKMAH